MPLTLRLVALVVVSLAVVPTVGAIDPPVAKMAMALALGLLTGWLAVPIVRNLRIPVNRVVMDRAGIVRPLCDDPECARCRTLEKELRDRGVL